jgi:hypothetical protein
MSSVLITGDTSGTVTLAAPAIAGTTSITLPASTNVTASVSASVTNKIAIVINGTTYYLLASNVIT